MSLHLERRGVCAVLTLDRPDALNALSFAIIDEIGARLDQVAASDARALIVTGAGPKAFCAGADIKELRGRGQAEQRRGAERGQAVFAKLDTLPMPSVAAINGFAFGEGDRLDLQGQTFTTGTSADGDVVLTLSGGGTIELNGVAPGSFSPG